MFARYLLAGEGHRLLTESFINAVLEDSGTTTQPVSGYRGMYIPRKEL